MTGIQEAMAIVLAGFVAQHVALAVNTPTARDEEGTVPEHTNRLIDETSPYLLQHAHNPVDWYPWGNEAIAVARAQDKPIFLSIGYSACHWCHVMEHECFENENVAALLNEHFVSIKVDREERPDLDEIYMTAVQMMTGNGGWPMTVFLTPDLEPFFGGTYFPAEDTLGRPGFKTLLTRIAAAWRDDRDALVAGASQAAEHIRGLLARPSQKGELDKGLLDGAFASLAGTYDAQEGGFRSAPKFPSAASIALLLRHYARTGEARALEMAETTLVKMASGGMFDHLGGGFHRYSVDAEWLMPHFEKMLYDNAQLAPVYLEAFQLTGKPFYRQVAVDILEYILRDLRDSAGGFHSSEDADSEGQEGAFYIWTRDEITEVLGEEDGEVFCRYYDVREDGNFASHEEYHRGTNILHVPEPLEAVAAALDMDPEALAQRLAQGRQVLLEQRAARVRPGLDDKILASWNGLMISAFAKGYQVLGEPRYRTAAEEAGAFFLDTMRRDGALLRVYRQDKRSTPGYLDDYAFLANGCIDLYEATFEPRWLEAADALAQEMADRFWDGQAAGFYFTEADQSDLLVRTKPTYDGAEPSGNAVAAVVLLRLAVLLDRPNAAAKAEAVLRANAGAMARVPQGHLNVLLALDMLLHRPHEIAVVGPDDSADTRALLEAVYAAFVPHKVVALLDPSWPNAAQLEERIPLLAGKQPVDGRPAAYVCRDFACQAPVTSPEALRQAIAPRHVP